MNTLLALCAAIVVQAVNQVELSFFVGSTLVHTAMVDEGSTHNYADLIAPSTMSAYECRDYEFVGWKAGDPIASGEVYDPSANTSVTPRNNLNIYAVFSTDPTKINNYIRVTQTTDLEDEGEYLIICYYVYGGEQQYYALTYVPGTYDYGGVTNYNRLNAERLEPRNGMIIDPDDGYIWTLEEGATPGTWIWHNEVGEKWLRLGDNNTTMVVDDDSDATPCIITQANGIFTIRNAANDIILKYVDDYITQRDDYFITGTYTDYVIYLYKKASPYTSYPDCSPWTVHLDALSGKIVGTSPAVSEISITETEAGDGVMLPAAVMAGEDCTGWTFVGWSLDAPIRSSATEPEDLIPASNPLDLTTKYAPLYNGVTLYAVYTKTETTYKYTKVTTGSTPPDGTYLIVAQNGTEYYALGNTDALSSTSRNYRSGSRYYSQNYYSVAPTSVVVNDAGEITGDQDDAIEWMYSSSQLRNVGNTSVYVNPHHPARTGGGSQSNPYVDNYYILGSAANITFQKGSGEKWGIYISEHNVTYNTSNGEFIYYNDNQYLYAHFYLFKKDSTITTSYTAYPRCVPYNVHMHACGGTVSGQADVMIPQASATAAVTLLTATPACPSEGWEFYGWFLGEDQESFENVEVDESDYLMAGLEYIPDYEDTHLYAVYRRKTDKFRILNYATEMVEGDEYLITGYGKSTDPTDPNHYDWEITNTPSTLDANYLGALKGEAPQGANGYYMVEDDSTAIWVMSGTYDNCKFHNVKYPTQYLASSTDGTTSINTTGTSYKFEDKHTSEGFSFIMQDFDVGTFWSDYYSTYLAFYMSYDSYFKSALYYADPGLSGMFVYRRVKEYSSWPHCDPFTVNFDPRGGSTEDDGSIKTESEPYAGIDLPKAFANIDCSKEGWSFAGWCTEPITEETSLMTFDLYPAGTRYYPRSTHTTLYAVYQNKTNHYKRIASLTRLHTGVNYIIATDDGKALKNLPSGETSIESQSVTHDAAHIITVNDPSIEWRLEGEKGEFLLHNTKRDVFLDLRLKQAKLQHPDDVEVQDNFQITYSEDKSYTIRSNRSLVYHTEEKYLGLDGSDFVAVDDQHLPTLYIYRQQSNYFSDPVCTEDIDVVKWAKIDDEFNSVTIESFHLKGDPRVHGSYGAPELQTDGTYLIKFRDEKLPPCTQAMVEWDGVTSRIRIPYIISEEKDTLSKHMIPANDCSKCDIYIEPNKMLTVSATDTIRKIYIPADATLDISNGQTLSAMIFSLFAEGDQAAPNVKLNSSGAIALRNDRLYYDFRIDEARYYWFALPFDAHLNEISFVNEAANDGKPEYYAGTDGDGVDRAFFVKYYNGALRATDANGGALATTYWTDVSTRGKDYVLKAGQGYELGLADQAHKHFNEQTYTHKYRTFRFTLRPDNTWLAQEQTGGASKSTIVTPSTCNNEKNAVHAGWNFIGNPYIHTYNTGDVPEDGNIRNGAWMKEKDKNGDFTGWWILDTSDPENRPTSVPYLTLYDPTKRKTGDSYRQVLAASHDLRPFEAVFVQVNAGTTLNFGSYMSVSAMPAYKRFLEPEGPVRTGITISGADRTDRAGFVLDDEYTTTYEIGADLEKIINSYTKKGVTTYNLNLYSFNADNQQLAFNGLSPLDALDTIPLGITFPATGEYTFAYDDEWYGAKANYFEAIELIDRQTQDVTNLLQSVYTFNSTVTGPQNNRFALVIRLKEQPNVPTGIETVPIPAGWDKNEAVKFIHNGQLFILKGNEIYNAVGTRVR